MTDIDTILRECCSHAGIEPEIHCPALDCDCEKEECVDWPRCPSAQRTYPPAAEVVEKLKKWCVENDVLLWHTNWCADCKPEVAYRAEVLPRNLSVERDDDVPHAEAATETDAFLRAYHAAFVRKEGE